MSQLATFMKNGVLIVTFSEVRLADDRRIDQLGKELVSLMRNAVENKMLLNFRNVQFMGSSMIGQLISLNRKCKDSGMSLRFCCLNKNLREVLELMKLNKVLTLCEDEKEAMTSFTKKSRFGWFKRS